MSDEMNGDPSALNPLSRHSSLSPHNSDYDAGTGRLKCYKGSAIGNNHNSRDLDKDDGSNPGSPNICSEDIHSSGGGRLKFFKDGKFILELSHRKEGEKTCWIPVPKKTYWPVIGTPRQESSASLSVSDDNFSVQSSPWQRDHCWKQPTPRQNLSRELEFCHINLRRYSKLHYTSLALRSKRRRPFVPITVDDEEMEKVSLKSRKRTSLVRIVQSLWERVMTSTCKSEPGIVSPRKRILRELERVTLEEATKRQRARAPLRNVSSHSISSILAKEDESVLRTLLRSPSPESVRSYRVPSSSFVPPHSTTASSGATGNLLPPPPVVTSVAPSASPATVPSYYPPYPPHIWHYPVSSPPIPLPLYHVPPYPWPHIHRPLPPESSSDVPLNLSKHAG